MAQLAVLGLLVAAGILGAGWPAWASPWRWLAAAAVGIPGLGLLAGGIAGLGRQLTPLPAPVEAGALRDRGVYGRCRHPMYGGAFLCCLAWALASAPLALAPAALVAGFIEAKRRVEEAWLRERYAGYAAYALRVRWRFLPGVW